MLERELILPPRNGQGENETLNCREPVVIIGANGSGKSRLGFWIEQNQSTSKIIHRIFAQRLLSFSQFIQPKNVRQAECKLYYGDENPRRERDGEIFRRYNTISTDSEDDFYHFWDRDNPNYGVIDALNDYDILLSLLLARRNERNENFVNDCKEGERQANHKIPEMRKSPDEEIVDIWNDILPHRQLKFEPENGLIIASFSEQNKYLAREMSDGERVVLYLMAQCLCVPVDSILIIDEPEIHLHRSLMSKLWTKLEEARPDCLFIYITHDLDFAASRVAAKKIWIKKYDGKQWIWDEVPEEENLPEPVLLEILGSRKKILFVEGEKGSLDYKLYQAIYPDFLIIPRGGCEKVIESTKAMRHNSALHHVEAFGLIDIDYRSDEEIKCLEKYGIFILRVAEVENLFCVQELIELVAERQLLPSKEVYQQVSDFVIQTLDSNLEEQVTKRSISEIEFRLNMLNTKCRGKAALTNAFTSLVNSIDVEQIYDKNMKLYQSIISNRNYLEALQFYNNKGLSKMISRFFHFQSGGYGDYIIRLLSTEHKNAIVSGLKKYVPTMESIESLESDYSSVVVGIAHPTIIDKRRFSLSSLKNVLQRFYPGKSTKSL